VNGRLFIMVIVGAALSFSAGVAVGMVVQSHPVIEAETATPLPNTASEAERREHVEKFFGGDPNRDIRGGQEMRPRW
jgi:Ti type entry exclusion protein TrbK